MIKHLCIFCRIIKGKVSAYRIFENRRILAFLDIHPLSKGHTLVIPKRHVARIEELNIEEAEALFKALYGLVTKIQVAVNAPSCTIAINNGVESGQEIPHLHVHIIPRFANDGGYPIHVIMKRRPYIRSDEMKQIAKRISNASNKKIPMLERN